MKTQNGHFEIVCATKSGERTFWTRIGAAFPLKNGHGYRVKMNFVPTSKEAEIMLLPLGAKADVEEQ